MTRPHHRKKHKEKLRQYKQHYESSVSRKARTSVSTIFAIAGAVIGWALVFFATQGVLLWSLPGLLIGGLAGFLIGRKMDHAAKK